MGQSGTRRDERLGAGVKGMTEREKRAAGLAYRGNDPDIVKDIDRCHTLCHRFNNCIPSDDQLKKEILSELLGSTGRSFCIVQPFYCDFGYNIHLGECFFANMGLTILDSAEVSFGAHANCCFFTSEHALYPKQRNEGVEYAKPIHVGNNVWIGGNVTVLAGVNIGDNSIIGAGSVVTSDIPENVISAGVPCKVIRNI